MTAFTSGQTITLTLDYDDYVMFSGAGVMTVTPYTGSSWQTYLTGNQVIGPFKQAVAVSVACTSDGSYTKYAVDDRKINSPELYGASPNAVADSNIAAIQSALNASGDVTLKTTGTFSTNATLVTKSNTAIELGAATRIKQAASTAKRMLSNSNEVSTLITLGSAITSAASAFSTEYLATAPVGAGHPFTPGSYVLLKGDTTRTYNGVWEVYSTTPTTISFLLGKGSAVPGNSAGTVTASLADANIMVDGGVWDYNAQNNTAGSADYNGHMLTLNKVHNAVVNNIKLADGLNYGVLIANAHACRISNVSADTGKDGLHLYSATNCLVENVSGTYGDDVVAVSHNNPTGYTQYALESISSNADTLGDIENLSFQHLHPKRTAGAVVALYPGIASLGKKFDGIALNDLSCSDGATQILNINNNVDAGAKSVGFVSAKGMRGKASAAMALVEGSSNSLLTVDKLELSDIYPSRDAGAAYTKNAAVAVTYGVVNKLVLDNFYPYIDIGSARYGVYFTDGSSYSPDITVKNFALETTSSGSSLSLLAASGAAGFKSINIENGRLLAGSALLAGSWPSTTKFFVKNVTVDGGNCLMATPAATFDIFCSDCNIVSASQTCAFNFYASSGSGTINLYVKNLKHALTDIIANLNKTFQTVNLYGDATAKTDITKLGTAANQQAVHNGATVAGTIDSGAMCVCDPAGVWRQMSDPVNKHYP